MMEPGFENDSSMVRNKITYPNKNFEEHREEPQMVFYLKRNNKVQSIEVGYYYDDSE